MASPTEQECCPVCKSPAAWSSKDGGVWGIACPKCGNFDIGWIAARNLKQFSTIQAANLSGWIRENQGVAIAEPALKNLAKLRTPTVGEKAEKILLHLAVRFPKPGNSKI